jgi:broad specificity phosphatase PhoE
LSSQLKRGTLKRMTLILIRHGHKGSEPLLDPALSSRGWGQAHQLFQCVEQGRLPCPTHCWYSEKIRTRQTLSGIIDRYNPAQFERLDLSIRGHTESNQDFRQRIARFLSSLSARSPGEVHYVCTHIDWIDEADSVIELQQAQSLTQGGSFAPGQYVVLQHETKEWIVIDRGVVT